MQQWLEESQIPRHLASVVTIGIFDGVHRGHRKIIRKTVDFAQDKDFTSVAITFDPHPSLLHRPQTPVSLIQPLPDRIDALATLGLDALWIVPYTWDLANLTAEEFIYRYFVKTLNAQIVVVGQDMRFGKNNSGGIATLRELGEKYGFEVFVVDDFASQEGRRFSSTWIRELLAAGNVEAAARVLGHSYRLRGVVEKGFQRGRELGFPTANLGNLEGLALPKHGVYAGVLIRKVPNSQAVEHLPAAISVGNNPQFGAEKTTVEAHVLGRGDLNLYGQEVAIDFRAHLRDMQKFESVEALLAQMDIDIARSAELLGVPPVGRINPSVVTADCEENIFS